MPVAPRRGRCGLITILGLAAAVRLPVAGAQEVSTDPRPAPPRAEGEGPFGRLVIRNATVIDGTGAPPRGPVDIVVERNRIAAVVTVGATAGDMRPGGRPGAGDKEIDATPPGAADGVPEGLAEQPAKPPLESLALRRQRAGGLAPSGRGAGRPDWAPVPGE